LKNHFKMTKTLEQKNKTSVPKLRFRGFNDSWKYVALSKLLKESKTRNEDLKYGKEEVLSVSGKLGVVNQIGHLGRSYAGESVHNYHVVENGEIVYTKSPLKNNPYGIIKLNKGDAGIVSTLYAVYKPIIENCYAPFLDHYFSLDANTNRYLRPLVKMGAKNDMKISNTYVLHDKIYVPSVSEQKKITSFVDSIDDWLSKLQKQSELLTTYKSGMMQKIFSQEFRFKTADNKNYPAWKRYLLGDLFNERTEKNGKQNHDLLSVSMNRGVTKQDSSEKRDSSSVDKSNYKVVYKNDIAYNTMRMWQGASGVSPFTGIVSPAYTVVFPKWGNIDFYKHLFKHSRTIFDFYRYSQGMTSDTWNLKFKHFSEVEVEIPTSVEEQQKIASFLDSIDELSVATKRQLTQAEEWKKGLLQQIFI
jgi:type I restriction enzyme, S subunit